MTIQSALELADSLTEAVQTGEDTSQVSWALRVLAGAYRRQQDLLNRYEGALRECEEERDSHLSTADRLYYGG